MEGIAAHRAASGETILTLISDDNFSPLQRTLLMQFALPRQAAAAAPARLRSDSSLRRALHLGDLALQSLCLQGEIVLPRLDEKGIEARRDARPTARRPR